MTVAAGAAKAGPYTGNDSASAFAFSFKVFADGDIRVVETLIATEVETDLVLNTNYTVTRNVDQDNTPGGTITYKVGGVTTALPSTKKITIVGDFDFTQPTDIPNGGSFFASIVEAALDRCTSLIKQVKERVDRAVVVDVSSSDDPDDLIDSLLAAAAAAAVSESNAATSESNAATSESNAATSESNAAASATAAQTAVNSMMWQDVSFKTAADSPITIGVNDTGKLFAIDCTAGAVTVNLPQISGLDLTLPWSVGIKKTDTSTNAITINRASTDTIDGATSKAVAAPDAGTVLIPDTDTTPDEWTSADFGPSTINMIDETFTDGVGFTAGVSTTLTLANSYASETNLAVHFDGVFQGPDTYSLSGTTLTFSSAIPVATAKVYVKGTAPLPIGVPGDNTVSTAKLVDAAVTPAKLAGGTVPASTGYSATPYNAGTKSSGTFTPDEANGNFQYCVNGGAFTLAPPTNNCTLIIQITNNGSAGAITTSGFTKVTGTAPGTTNGDDFLAYITKINGFSHLSWQALQ